MDPSIAGIRAVCSFCLVVLALVMWMNNWYILNKRSIIAYLPDLRVKYCISRAQGPTVRRTRFLKTCKLTYA